jgi:hypothetical protein
MHNRALRIPNLCLIFFSGLSASWVILIFVNAISVYYQYFFKLWLTIQKLKNIALQKGPGLKN